MRKLLSTDDPNMPPGASGNEAGRLTKCPASKVLEAMSTRAKPMKLNSKNGFSFKSTASNFK